MAGETLERLPALHIDLIRAPDLALCIPRGRGCQRGSRARTTPDSRIQIPNHDNGVVAPARKPAPRVCPAHGEHRPRVHRQRAEQLRRPPRHLRVALQDRLRAPDAYFSIQPARRNARAVGMELLPSLQEGPASQIPSSRQSGCFDLAGPHAELDQLSPPGAGICCHNPQLQRARHGHK